MANLFFPQLSSGAVAQYPIRKTRIARTVRNILLDGSEITYPDIGAAQLVWQLGYTALSLQDLDALTTHFNNCQGRLQPFTFIDPTDNMLGNSANLMGPLWQTASSIQVGANIADPIGGTAAFSATNNGQVSQQIAQTVLVPSGYQFCFSIYVQSAQPAPLELIRSGPTNQQATNVMAGVQWTRVISSGVLADQGSSLKVAVNLMPGQKIFLYGPQLEAQATPSRYRPTVHGGVYANAHWGVDELPISADAPNLFSTAFTIGAAI